MNLVISNSGSGTIHYAEQGGANDQQIAAGQSITVNSKQDVVKISVPTVQPRTAGAAVATMSLMITNNGQQAVRYVDTDGVTEYHIQPGEAYTVTTKGDTIQLRELGNVQQPAGQQEAP